MQPNKQESQSSDAARRLQYGYSTVVMVALSSLARNNTNKSV